MNEAEKEEVRKEAKEILDKFAKSLERVKLKEKELKRTPGGFRKEGAGSSGDLDFRKKVFENAPNKEGECIVAEKKTW